MDVSNCDLHSLPETTIVQIIHQGHRVTGEIQSRLKLIKYEIAFDENPAEKIVVSRSQIKTKRNTFQIGDAIYMFRNQSTAKVCKILDHSVYLIALLESDQYEWYHRSEVTVPAKQELSEEKTTPEDDAVTGQNMSEAKSENETKVEETE